MAAKALKSWLKTLKRYWLDWPYLTGAIVASLSIGCWLSGAWQPWEYHSYNLLFQLRNSLLSPQTEWDHRLAVITIDEASLDTYGRLPAWNRQHYAQLLEVLADSPPAAIGFDLIFSEPSPEDQVFAQEIAFNGAVALGVGIDEQQQPIPIVPELAQVSWLGHIVTKVESDGITRQNPLYLGDFPALSITLLQIYNQGLVHTLGTGKIDSTVPLPQPSASRTEQWVWLNWPASVETLPTFSFVDVVQEKVDPRLLANKIVLVGVTARGLEEPLRTPFNPNSPVSGVYLYTTAIDNLLQNRFLSRLPESLTLLVLILLALSTTWLLHERTWQVRLVILGGLLLFWTSLALVSFSFFCQWLPVAAPLGTILLGAIGLQLREQQEKQELMRLFSQHVAPEMAEVIWKHKAEIFQQGQLESQELTATVLFADLRGFTTISENLSPKELLNWLNLYLKTMTECVMKHGGVIDKYIGDAVMAVFGVPFARTDEYAIRQDALNAVAASLDMHRAIEQINSQLALQGKPLMKIGIGIHTGVVVAGSMGGMKRLNFSVVGDTVNIAARLETLNKQIKSPRPYAIIIGDRTLAYVGDHYEVEEVGLFQLRGKLAKTKAYSVSRWKQ